MSALAIGERARKPPKPASPYSRRSPASAPPPLPRSSLRAQRAEEREKRLIKEAIDYFEIAIEKGALAAATDRACEYASKETWAKLTKRWNGKRCQTLAQIARDVLEGKEQIHAGIGKVAGFLVGLFKGGSLERTFAAEIVSRIPLPILDEKLTATARGLQIVGIGVCCMQGYDLSRCACFVDVAKFEGKAQLKKLVLTGAEDWASLSTFSH
ncbi:hypothetical protein ACTWPT_42715 [Nonomuraea sp. 3N208]|uniref:hypothetical protein n=1 Tax=Nonomuraea sp. 3N208 TaxID=3457421 RepID=UPI003FD5BE8B